MTGRLYFTVGAARSGKSTYCDRWARSPERVLAGVKTPRAVVAGDDFRLALYGREYSPRGEGAVFAMMDVASRALLARGFDVIVDETATTEETVRRYLRIDPEAVPVFVQCPPEECLRRAHAAGRGHLVNVVGRHHRQLESLLADWPGTFARLKKEIAEECSENC